MIYREKPCFIIKKNLQKSGTTGVYFFDSVTKQVLKDVCYKILKLNDISNVRRIIKKLEDNKIIHTYYINKKRYFKFINKKINEDKMEYTSLYDYNWLEEE